MNVAASKPNPKFHSPMPHKEADMTPHGVATQLSSHSISTGTPGDLPGSHAAEFATSDYGQGKHMAYDSPLAQPAYDGSGKVKVGSTSVL
jgi:hypothetical protein